MCVRPSKLRSTEHPAGPSEDELDEELFEDEDFVHLEQLTTDNPKKYTSRMTKAIEDAEALRTQHNKTQATAARNTLKALFDEADADSSGTLSTDELATVVKKYYRTEGKSRSAKAVQREVDEAMAVYDQDKNGVLCFDEFLQMVLTSRSFNFTRRPSADSISLGFAGR